jgi:hypothetical protein
MRWQVVNFCLAQKQKSSGEPAMSFAFRKKLICIEKVDLG